VRQGIQTLVSIALARLLTPEAFGTIALLALFASLADVFVDGGFSAGLIRKRDATIADESTVFWLNIAIAVACALLMVGVAPMVSRFYGLPVLRPLMVVMALNVILTALASLQGTLMDKRLDFGLRMKIGAAAKFSSAVTAVWMAWDGFGVWALAAQTIASTVVTTALFWTFSSWRPAWTFSLASAKELFGFGGYLLISRVIGVVYDRGYSLLIGKIYGTRELGIYGRADNLQQIPAGLLGKMISTITYPLFSIAAGDKARLRRGVQAAVRSSMLVNVPMMLGLLAVAECLVPVLLGPQWTEAVPLVRILSLAAILWPLHVINLDALLARGHSRLYFRLLLIKNLVGTLVLVGFSYLFGLMGLAWAQTLLSAAAFFLNAHYTGKHLGYGPLDQLRDIFPIVAVSSIMAATVFATASVWPGESALKLAVLIAVGGGVFLAAAFGAKLSAVEEALNILGGSAHDPKSNRSSSTAESSTL
jgi:O-antigen/teichoic acid export membrane protein